MIKYLIVLAVFFFAGHAQGAALYVDVDASGSATGADWTNAYTSLQTAENAASRGDTIYVAEGTYSESVDFDVAESGTTVITVSKCGSADGVCTSAAGYNSADHDEQAIFSPATGDVWEVETGYWTFDGVTGGGPGSWDSGHGFKLLSDISNGSARGFYCYADIDNIELKRIEIEGSGNTDFGGQYNFYANYQTGTLEGWLIQRCYFHDANSANIITKGFDSLTVEYSLIARNYSDQAFHGEAWTAEYDDNVIVRYNVFEDNQGSGIIFFKKNGNCSPVMDGWEIYGNLFWWTPDFRNKVDVSGTGGTATSGSSTVMNDTTASFPTDDSFVGDSINNSTDGTNTSCTITAHTSTSVTCSGGLANGGVWDAGDSYYISRPAAGAGVVGRKEETDGGCDPSAGAVTNLKFYNNTIAFINYDCWNGVEKKCSSSGATIYIFEGSSNTAKNNIVMHSYGAYGNWTNVDHSYNWYYEVINSSNGNDNASTLASETGGQLGTGDPFTNSDLRTGFLLEAATDDGDSTIGATYNTDFSGTTRGADGVWDRGWYEYATSAQVQFNQTGSVLFNQTGTVTFDQ